MKSRLARPDEFPDMTTVSARPERPLSAELLRLARPKQWLKNVLVFAAPGAAGVLTHRTALLHSAIMFVAFCAAASGTYFLNDAADVESDRMHPTKCNRPLAAGTVSMSVGRIGGAVLVATGVAIAGLTFRWQSAAMVAIYVAVTFLYTVWLKHVAVVDLVVVAVGFVIRAVAGAVAVSVPLSNWFLIFTSFGSMFIVTGKRYAELVELGEDAAGVRATLDAYDGPYLRLVMGSALTATLLAYCLWAFERAKDVPHARVPLYTLSIIPLVTALLRYLLVLESGKGSAPEDVFFNDRPLQVLGLIWAALFALGVYVR